MRKRSVGLLVLTLVAAVGLLGGHAAAATFPKTNIRFAHTGVAGIPFHEGVERFAQLVKERTGGAVTVQIFPASQLGSEKDFVEQVKTGVIEMALTGPMNIAVYDGWGPAGVLAMPYILQGRSEEELARKLVKLTRSPLFVTEIGEKAAKASSIRCLDMGWWFGERHLTTSKKAVAKPEDVKGLKVRTMDTPVAKSAMSALGASTVPMAVAELYTALQMGVVDGQENPFNIIYNRKFFEVQKYLTLTGHMAMNLVIIINEKFHQKLSPELQQLLTKAAMEAGDFQSELTIKVNTKNLQDLKDKGMVIAEVNRADFARATKDAWKEFESTFGKGMYERIVQEAARYSSAAAGWRWNSGATPIVFGGVDSMAPLRFVVKNFEEIAAGTFLVLMSLATFGNVVMRYAFNSPIQWAEEFSRYAFIWVVFLGAAACSKRKTHIVIDAIAALLPPRTRALCSLVVETVVLVLMGAITYYGYTLCTMATQATSTLKIPQYAVYAVVPFSAALIFFHALGGFCDSLRKLVPRESRP